MNPGAPWCALLPWCALVGPGQPWCPGAPWFALVCPGVPWGPWCALMRRGVPWFLVRPNLSVTIPNKFNGRTRETRAHQGPHGAQSAGRLLKSDGAAAETHVTFEFKNNATAMLIENGGRYFELFLGVDVAFDVYKKQGSIDVAEKAYAKLPNRVWPNVYQSRHKLMILIKIAPAVKLILGSGAGY